MNAQPAGSKRSRAALDARTRLIIGAAMTRMVPATWAHEQKQCLAGGPTEGVPGLVLFHLDLTAAQFAPFKGQRPGVLAGA